MRFASWFPAFGAALLGCSSPSENATQTGGASNGGTVAAAGMPSEAGKSPVGGGGAGAGTAGANATGATAGTSGASSGVGGQAGSGGQSGSAGSSSGGNAGAGGSGSGGGGGSGGEPSDTDRCQLANYDAAAPPKLLSLTGNLGTHDPMILSADNKFYLFSTGNNIGAKTSSNLEQWQASPDVLSASTRPAWLAQQVPGVSNLWAPDAAYFGGAYHLYYSASTFGKNRSCIGHLSRPSLANGSWKDEGPVFCSNVSSTDDFNAIDPNVIVDTDGTPWLSFGSFWSGIKLIKLDASGARAGTSLDALASRPSASGALEAPFIVRRCGYYYLFTSWDKCCDGANSTYNTRVGRASTLRGPYTDRAGKALLEGGGTLVLQGGPRYKGPGHNAVLFTANNAYNVYHAYDADNGGASVLRIAELHWDSEGWPISAGP
jgi:arabinan endo-1,5-alpha-L-arabinosidase